MKQIQNKTGAITAPVFVGLLFVAFSASFFLLTAWLWPFRPLPVKGFTQEALAFASALILLIGLSWHRLHISLSVLFALVLACIPLAQWWSGTISFAGSAWLNSLYLLCFALMLLVGSNLAARQDTSRLLVNLLAATLVLAGILSTWIALRQYLHLADSNWEINLHRSRPYANLAQPNNLATLLGMGLAACLYFYERHLLGKIAAALIAFFLIVGMAATQSRTPWVTTFAVLVFWLIKSGSFKPRLRFVALCGWAACYAFFVVTLPLLYSFLDFSGASLMQRAAALERWALWSQMWFAITQGPFWGYGWDQTGAAQVAITLEQPLHRMTGYSHNLVLDLMLWIGLVPGGILVGIALLWLARLGWLARSKESLFALIAAGFILVHSMLEFPFAYAYFLLPLGLLLGIASADKPERTLLQLPRFSLLPIIAGGCWLLLITFTDHKILVADHLAQRMEAAHVIGFENRTPVSEVRLLTQYRELQRFKSAPVQDGYDEDQLVWMQKVVHQYPHLANLYRYVLILYRNDQPKQAEHYLEILCGLHRPHLCEEAQEQLTAFLKELSASQATSEPSSQTDTSL